MFYFLLPSLVTYDFVLVIAAVVPAIFLMIQAYRSDRLEKESPGLLWGLVKAGIFSSLIALVAERVLGFLLDLTVQKDSVLYNVILYFVIVAFAEEDAKFFMLRRHTHGIRPNSTAGMTALFTQYSSHLGLHFGKISAMSCLTASPLRSFVR